MMILKFSCWLMWSLETSEEHQGSFFFFFFVLANPTPLSLPLSFLLSLSALPPQRGGWRRAGEQGHLVLQHQGTSGHLAINQFEVVFSVRWLGWSEESPCFTSSVATPTRASVSAGGCKLKTNTAGCCLCFLFFKSGFVCWLLHWNKK